MNKTRYYIIGKESWNREIKTWETCVINAETKYLVEMLSCYVSLKEENYNFHTQLAGKLSAGMHAFQVRFVFC